MQRSPFVRCMTARLRDTEAAWAPTFDSANVGGNAEHSLALELKMEHTTFDLLERVAEVHVSQPPLPHLSRDERLTRWAELLEDQPDRLLRTLPGTEYRSWETRDSIRSPDSPISLALQDPILNADGLKGDTYGDAKGYFALSDHQLHDIVCYCHFGQTVKAGDSARHVRAAIGGPAGAGALARLRQAIAI
jgi:hypothetical protein